MPNAIDLYSPQVDVKAVLRSLPAADAQNRIVATLAEQEKRIGGPDVDKLLSLGLATTKSGHESLDQSIVQWLVQTPTVRRLDAVSGFLAGAWLGHVRKTPVRGAVVKAFTSARNSVQGVLDAGAEGTYGMALLNLLEDPRATQDVRAYAKTELAKLSHVSSPGVASILERARALDDS